uniref:transglutaminaseTgpA domain-containing protein n=1 Tax=Nocardioides lijunqiniae TaxID=2760832 RepID=UPI00187800AD
MSVLKAAARLAWPLMLLVLGSIVLASTWGRVLVTLGFVLTAVVPLLVLRAVLRLGVSRWAATTVLVLLTTLAAYLATSGADLSLSQTVRDVVPRLLTAPRPYAVAPDLLVGPLLLTALVSLFTGLRVDSTSKVEPVLGAAVLYVAGMLLTGGDADPWGLVAVLILVTALLGWVFLDEHSEPVRQRFAVAGPLTVVGVGLLAAVATLPAQDPFEPRELVDPPLLEVVASSPLTQLGAWAVNPGVELLRVRGDEVPLRLVTLERYDGRQWTAATRFAPLGTGGDRALPDGDRVSEATVEVALDELAGGWLPSPGRPRLVSDRDALVDPTTGTVYTPEDTDGLGYEVTGTFDDPPDAALAAASVPTRGVGRYLDLPELPFALSEYAARVTRGARTPYEQATAIQDEIRGDAKLSPRAISGSAMWRIEAFLVGKPGEPGARVGTSEQFATAFALVARANGLPSRVVVGFRPGTSQDDGSRLVTGADAFAWPEVYFDGPGWVPFSPSPDDDTFKRDAFDDVGTAPQPTPGPTGAGPSAAGSSAGAPAGDDGDAAPTPARDD